MVQKLKATLFFDYLLITLGSFFLAFGLIFFLEPNTIAPGGVSGLAIIIERLTGIPIDVMILAINIPLFFIGIMTLGKQFGLKTAYGTVSLSLAIRLIIVVLGENIIGVEDVLLATLYGGVLMGIGMGLVFKAGGTTGGTDLAGAILNKYIPSLSMPKLMMGIDLAIVVTAGIVNKKLETSLYSIIALYILVKIADFIMEGLNYAKAFMIITDFPKEISEVVMNTLERGVTSLYAKGMYTGKEKAVLLCIVNRTQVAKLKNIVNEIDPKAFVMVTTIHEVLGEGFTKE
ncbi:YitT family protein [Clostridiaceae bacterium 35-E11]